MLNRIAESLFWIGRYTERVENHARLIDVYYHLREETDLQDSLVWKRLIHTLGSPLSYEERYGTYVERDVMDFITLDPNQVNSLISCVGKARENLRMIRERLPAELWDTMNCFYLWLNEQCVDDILQESPHLFLKKVKDLLSMFQGNLYSIMPRDGQWHMFECGKYLERSENTVRLLQSIHSSVSEEQLASYPYLLAVLKSVSGYEAFLRYFSDDLTLENVAFFLVRNDIFPRSIQFSMTSLENHLKAIRSQEESLSPSYGKVLRLAGKVRSDLGWLEKSDIHFKSLEEILFALLQTNLHIGEIMLKSFFQSEQEVSA